MNPFKGWQLGKKAKAGELAGDDLAHQKSTEEYRVYVDDPDASMSVRSITEGGQYIYYGIGYGLGLQDQYDPWGLFNGDPNDINAPLSGREYIRDMRKDIRGAGYRDPELD